MSEWQPIETAPRDGTSILVYVRGLEPVSASECSWIGAIYWSWFDPIKYPALATSNGWACLPWQNSQPTHWMPLPEPPK